jgi:hypothetical protein
MTGLGDRGGSLSMDRLHGGEDDEGGSLGKSGSRGM